MTAATAVGPRTGRTGSVATTALLTAVTAATISTVYLPQPLLAPLAADFHVSTTTAGLVATAAQLGYAAGILLILPVSALLAARRLVPVLMGASAVLLVLTAIVPSLGALAVLAALAGAASVVPQVLIPLAHRLAAEGREVQLIGALSTGIGVGIFGSRVLAGLLAGTLGWRAVPVALAALLVLLALLAAPRLPGASPRSGGRRAVAWARTLRSLPGLLRTRPALRGSAFMQFWTFSALNTIWSVATVYLTAVEHWPLRLAGLIGLVGLLAALLTPVGARLVARRGAPAALSLALALGVVGTGAALSTGTAAGVAIAGFLTAVATLWSQVAHQRRIFTESPDSRVPVNIVFMVASFSGGALGAALGPALFAAGGVRADAAVAAAQLGVALVVALPLAVRARTRTR